MMDTSQLSSSSAGAIETKTTMLARSLQSQAARSDRVRQPVRWYRQLRVGGHVWLQHHLTGKWDSQGEGVSIREDGLSYSYVVRINERREDILQGTAAAQTKVREKTFIHSFTSRSRSKIFQS